MDYQAEWRRFAIENRKIEITFIPKIKTAINRQLSSFIDDMQTMGVNYALQQMAFYPWNSDLVPLLQSIYKRAGLRGAISEYQNLQRQKNQKIRGFGFNEQWVREVLDYLAKNLLEKAVIAISETTKKHIQKVIDQGLNEGWGFEMMARSIKNPEITKARAEVIARTEVIKAANTGHMIAAKTFPYQVTKQWIAADDERTRDSHREVNETSVDEYGKFGNGLLYPGDPAGPAEEVINCRCRVIYNAKRDNNGLLIPR